MLIIDANVAVKLVTAEAGQPETLARIRTEPELSAPDWLLIEVGHALWRKTSAGLIHPDAASESFAELPAYLEKLIPSANFTPMALALAFELAHSPYDCLFLACALDAGAALLTADRKFWNAAKRAGYEDIVELLTWEGQAQ